MPKVGMEPIRRKQLVTATIDEIGAAGNLDVTVSQIAKRAGMSSALAHHYFGSKEQIFLAAMRHVLTVYGAEVRGALAMAQTPKDRLSAIIKTGFSGTNFRHDVISTWLNFYVLAQTSPEANRLLNVYQKRLHSNLVHAFRPLIGDKSHDAALRICGLIDGIYLREALGKKSPNGAAAIAQVMQALTLELGHQK